MDYRQPIGICDRPIGKMWIKKMESVRVGVSAEISVKGKVAALGEQVCVFVNLQTNKPIRVPETLKQKYGEFVG